MTAAIVGLVALLVFAIISLRLAYGHSVTEVYKDPLVGDETVEPTAEDFDVKID